VNPRKREIGVRRAGLAAACLATMLAIALCLSGDVGTWALLSLQRRSPWTYAVALTAEVSLASMAAAGIAVVASCASAAVRWAGMRAGWLRQERVWRDLATIEGALVGLVAAGAYLGYAPGDTYRSPDGTRSLEVRKASRIARPLGMGIASPGVAVLTVIYRGAGQPIVKQTYTFGDIPGHPWSVRWSERGNRAIVALQGSDECLLLPAGVSGLDACLEEALEEIPADAPRVPAALETKDSSR